MEMGTNYVTIDRQSIIRSNTQGYKIFNMETGHAGGTFFDASKRLVTNRNAPKTVYKDEKSGAKNFQKYSINSSVFGN